MWKRIAEHSSHTPPFITHTTTHTVTDSTHHRASPPPTHKTKEETTAIQERQDNARGAGQYKAPDPHIDGTPQHTPHPAIQQDHMANGRGTPHTRRGGQQHSRPSLTMPPTIHHATPPSTMAPPTTTTRGEHTEDTPPHEHHRHTPTTHTPHTWQGTVRDMTAVLASTAVG